MKAIRFHLVPIVMFRLNNLKRKTQHLWYLKHRYSSRIRYWVQFWTTVCRVSTKTVTIWPVFAILIWHIRNTQLTGHGDLAWPSRWTWQHNSSTKLTNWQLMKKINVIITQLSNLCGKIWILSVFDFDLTMYRYISKHFTQQTHIYVYIFYYKRTASICVLATNNVRLVWFSKEKESRFYWRHNNS